MEVRTVQSQQGSAVVIVLIFLGIVSMIGVGLLMQSQLDLQFASALTGSDRRQDLSEMGVTYLFAMPPSMEHEAVTPGQPTVVRTPDPNSPQETGYWAKVPYQQNTDLRRIYIGPAAITDCAGYEMGRSGDYRPSSTNKYYYVLDAVAGVKTDSAVPGAKVPARALQETIIQMGCLRCQ